MFDPLSDLICHLDNLRNLKNSHGGVLLLVKMQDEACIFTKGNTPPWMFFTFFKQYKCYLIAQCISYLVRMSENQDQDKDSIAILSRNISIITYAQGVKTRASQGNLTQ